MYVLFDKILVDLKQKIFLMQFRKNLQKKNLVMSLPNSFHIEKMKMLFTFKIINMKNISIKIKLITLYVL